MIQEINLAFNFGQENIESGQKTVFVKKIVEKIANFENFKMLLSLKQLTSKIA